jgi:hypothetical protein
VPVFVNGGHECLVAQVYDPVSDPIVAPFNPVQDRHVGQRNVSVLQVAQNQIVNFDVFSQNLGLSPANTLVEVQKLEGEALEVLSLTMGRKEVWRTAGATEMELTAPRTVRVRPGDHAKQLQTHVFRETLQDVPGVSESTRVGSVMRTLAAPRRARGLAAEQDAKAWAGEPAEAAIEETGEEVAFRQAAGDKPGALVTLAPGQHVRMALRTALPRTAEPGSADVWRIVEHTAGRITGGVTIIIQAKR